MGILKKIKDKFREIKTQYLILQQQKNIEDLVTSLLIFCDGSTKEEVEKEFSYLMWKIIQNKCSESIAKTILLVKTFYDLYQKSLEHGYEGRFIPVQKWQMFLIFEVNSKFLKNFMKLPDDVNKQYNVLINK